MSDKVDPEESDFRPSADSDVDVESTRGPDGDVTTAYGYLETENVVPNYTGTEQVETGETETEYLDTEYDQTQYVGSQYAEVPFTSEEVFEEQIYMDQPRRAELTVARVDPWSVAKIGFLVSIALGIATVVAAILLWFVLDGMHVFGSVEDFLIELNAERFLSLMEYVRLPRVMSYATILAVANVVILTALSALIALLYNLIAALVGGVRVSLMDE